MKPLFIPLNTEFYEAFARGEKTSELRLYGPRWNEHTCVPGRPVILSKGYGRQNRMNAVVVEFLKFDPRSLGDTQQKILLRIYGSLHRTVAEIRLQLTGTSA